MTINTDISTDLDIADFLGYSTHLTPEEQERLRQLRGFLREKVTPAANEYWSRDEFPTHLLPDLVGAGLGDIWSWTPNALFRGFVSAEIARSDVSMSVFLMLQSDLVMQTLEVLGSEEQKAQWLPGLRRMDYMGCFALTEPDHGSDVAGGLATSARRDGDEWVINGVKRWIGSGVGAKFAIVWARDEADHQVKGFIVEADRPGYTAEKIEHKTSLKMVQNAEITLDQVRIPAENLIEKAQNFKATSTILQATRAGIAWQSAGAQMGIFDIARDYALGRVQFGKPIASYQLIQERLVRILGNISATLGMAVQSSALEEADIIAMPQAALIKAKSSSMARESASLGREIMGGNGILADRGMGRFFNDVEAIYTYEGTYDMNTLIVGRAITGMSAFG